MPSNLLTADTLFPHLTEEQSTDEKFTVVTNYLYMLLEQLRYTLSNLGLDNINGAEFDSMSKIITDPVYIQLADDEGNISALQVTAQGLASRISDAEGNVSILQQTAASLTSRISSAEGNISTLQQTAASLTSQISDINGNISTLQQTSSSLTSRISSAEGNISTLQQTASGLTSRITSAEGNISSLTQTVNGFGLSVTNGTSSSRLYLTSGGVAIDSALISFTGMVTFTDLETSGTTLIHGGNIDTDTLKVNNLYGQYVYLRNSAGTVAGRLSITGASTATWAVDLESYGALRLTADYGDVYIGSGSGTYLQASSSITAGGGNLISNKNGLYSCGDSSHYWSDVYTQNCAASTSDLTKKHGVIYGLDAYDALFDSLRPMSFLFDNGTSGRRHWGFGAQDAEKALTDCGLTTMDAAFLIKSPRLDENGSVIEGEYDYAMRYGELVPMNTWQIQQIKPQVKDLLKRVEALEGASKGDIT